MDATRGVRRAGAARDHADARAAGELAVGVGHVGGADLVAAGDEAERRVVEGIEHGEVALAGDAEGDVDAVHDELVDEEPAAVLTSEAAGARGRRSLLQLGRSSSAGST